ncbi:MAG: hypothetical protein JSU98_16590 [Gemmatimonadales bacterium]|nr:MAG: hypothetical protein JSU98_16590 [Gemmatimonadales bacterium]
MVMAGRNNTGYEGTEARRHEGTQGAEDTLDRIAIVTPTTLFESEQPIVGYARVAVERGVDRYPDGLTYAIPATLTDLEPGARVVVPLGRGDTPTAGYVIEILTAGPAESPVKPIERRDESAACLPGQLVDLARWIAAYTCSPIGMTLASMLPAAVKRNIGSVTRTVVDLAEAPPAGYRPTARQAEVIRVLESLPRARRPVEIRRLAAEAGLRTTGPILRLVQAAGSPPARPRPPGAPSSEGSPGRRPAPSRRRPGARSARCPGGSRHRSGCRRTS